MKTKNKLVKKVMVSVLMFAIMLNIGLSVQTSEDSYFPELSLASMGVQAQDELGDSWWESAWDEVVNWFDDSGDSGDSSNQGSGAPSGIGYTVTTESYNDTIVLQANGNYEVLRKYNGVSTSQTVTTGGTLDVILAWFTKGK